MTAAGEDPIAVIQWLVEFVDREWPLWGKSNVRWRTHNPHWACLGYASAMRRIADDT
jgi:hypothetical protein